MRFYIFQNIKTDSQILLRLVNKYKFKANLRDNFVPSNIHHNA